MDEKEYIAYILARCPYLNTCTDPEEWEKTAGYLIKNGIRLETEKATSEENKRWISVTERLPELGDRCLCLVKSLAFPGCKYHSILRYDKLGFIEGCIYTDDVTHWMPLPEPPKEV